MLTYPEWLLAAQRQGKPLTHYLCPLPTCRKVIYALVPKSGQTYSAAVACPHCSTLHFKRVYRRRTDGLVEVAISPMSSKEA